jgi:predicted AlkP superfamily phosphohydrolase/phosphomutase
MDKKKVVVIGLDCASPELVFDRWLDKLPNMKKLVNSGIHGPIESSTPPILVHGHVDRQLHCRA